MKKMLYTIFQFKRYIEQVLMFPFVLYGKWWAKQHPLEKEFDYFFFLPAYGIGGAERVNAEIVESLNDKEIFIAFTMKSPNDGMLHFFKRPNVQIQDISTDTDNKKRYYKNFIQRGKLVYYINQQKNKPTIFIGQCNFGYKILPHINRDIHVVELIHVVDEKFLWVWATFLKFIDARIVPDDYFIGKFSEIHKSVGIPEMLLDKYCAIPYCLEYIPATKEKKLFQKPLKIYYAGRGGRQKRLWILFEIIRACKALKLPVEFKLAGSFQDELPSDLKEYYIGELPGGEAVYNFHKENDILLMTSAFEGFPVAIMEAIAFGSIIIAPAVDAIPTNVINLERGFIIEEVHDEVKMKEEAVRIIQNICDNQYDLQRISDNAFDHLIRKFTKEKFRESYRQVLKA